MNEKHLGSSLDDFLVEEGLLAEAEAVAWKRVVAFLIGRPQQQTADMDEEARKDNWRRNRAADGE